MNKYDKIMERLQKHAVNTERKTALYPLYLQQLAGIEPKIPYFLDRRVVSKYLDDKSQLPKDINDIVEYEKTKEEIEEQKQIGSMSKLVFSKSIRGEWAQFILRTFSDSRGFGCAEMESRMKFLNNSYSKDRKQLLVYPGAYDDIEHAVLFRAKHYELIDPLYDDEKNIFIGKKFEGNGLLDRVIEKVRYYSAEQIRIVANEFAMRMEIKSGVEYVNPSEYQYSQDSLHLHLPKSDVWFHFSPKEFYAREYEKKADYIFIKKPAVSLPNAVDKDLHYLLDLLEDDSNLIYCDLSGRVEKLHKQLPKNFELVENGELDCNRVYAGGEIDTYPANMYLKTTIF